MVCVSVHISACVCTVHVLHFHPLPCMCAIRVCVCVLLFYSVARQWGCSLRTSGPLGIMEFPTLQSPLEQISTKFGPHVDISVLIANIKFLAVDMFSSQYVQLNWLVFAIFVSYWVVLLKLVMGLFGLLLWALHPTENVYCLMARPLLELFCYSARTVYD